MWTPTAHAPTRQPWFRLALLVLGMGALTLAGCKKKTPPRPKPLEALQWQGLSLGMSMDLAKARMKELGWKHACQEPNTVVYLDGNALLTHWIKRAERKRAHRCDAVYKPKGKVAAEGRLRAKLFFLDGTLRQMNIVLERDDESLSKELRRRWGKFRNVGLDLYLYAAPRPGRLRALAFRRGEVTTLWLRKAKVHELIFASHTPEATRLMRGIATSRKDE